MDDRLDELVVGIVGTERHGGVDRLVVGLRIRRGVVVVVLARDPNVDLTLGPVRASDLQRGRATVLGDRVVLLSDLDPDLANVIDDLGDRELGRRGGPQDRTRRRVGEGRGEGLVALPLVVVEDLDRNVFFGLPGGERQRAGQLTGLITLDGIVLAAGRRVLVVGNDLVVDRRLVALAALPGDGQARRVCIFLCRRDVASEREDPRWTDSEVERGGGVAHDAPGRDYDVSVLGCQSDRMDGQSLRSIERREAEIVAEHVEAGAVRHVDAVASRADQTAHLGEAPVAQVSAVAQVRYAVVLPNQGIPAGVETEQPE